MTYFDTYTFVNFGRWKDVHSPLSILTQNLSTFHSYFVFFQFCRSQSLDLRFLPSNFPIQFQLGPIQSFLHLILWVEKYIILLEKTIQEKWNKITCQQYQRDPLDPLSPLQEKVNNTLVTANIALQNLDEAGDFVHSKELIGKCLIQYTSTNSTSF